MKISVVVVVYNMAREAPRTLHSLSTEYQDRLAADDYEVIVVENGSTDPLDPEHVRGFAGNFRYFYLAGAGPSPAPAVNFGLREARGAVVGVMIDGARIATPGLLHSALLGAGLYPRAIVASLGWYLGSENQRVSASRGYNQATEDALLERIGWPKDGYRLYEIATLDDSSSWFQSIHESNALFMRKDLWTEIGGMDELFDCPGGGLVNLDTLCRACEIPDSELVLLFGEGTFHQIHGGVATNAPPDVFERNMALWSAQYEQLRGREWKPSVKAPTYLGAIPPSALPHIAN